MLFKLVVSQLAVLSTAIPTGTSLKAASAMLEQGTNKTVSALGHGAWCGGHAAATCADCPQGHGAAWCNGECKWESNSCVTIKEKSPPPPPQSFSSCHDIPTQEGCTGGMCFWADGGCRSDIPPGATGDKGPAGDQGEQGPRGEKGEAGDAGGMEDVRRRVQMLKTRINRLMFQAGPKGDRGPQGQPGPKGDRGLPGTDPDKTYSMPDCYDTERDQIVRECKHHVEYPNLRYYAGEANFSPYIGCQMKAAFKKGCCPTFMELVDQSKEVMCKD